MTIKIKEISIEKLEENGWEYVPISQLYYKKFNECVVCIRSPYSDLTYGCWISYAEVATPEDLIAIGKELKKLEEN